MHHLRAAVPAEADFQTGDVKPDEITEIGGHSPALKEQFQPSSGVEAEGNLPYGSLTGGPAQLNLYGDVKQLPLGQCGHDIASQRLDELDRVCLKFATEFLSEGRKVNRALDLGCGKGIQGLRLALQGFETFLYDLLEFPDIIDVMREYFSICRLTAKKCDLRTIRREEIPANVAICYSQRFIHYLRRDEALQLLRKVQSRMIPNGKLFISASGLQSDIGRYHPHHDRPVQDRFGMVPDDIASQHNIYAPICPYSEKELVDLGREAGFSLDGVIVSRFGNIKACFTK